MKKSRARNVASAVAAALVFGCSGDDATPDGGTPVPDAGMTAVAPPAEAAYPIFAPCPTGWREAPDADGPTVCEPWPAAGPSDCPVGEAHFPGGAGCEVIGVPCPAGVFAADLPAGTVYVDAAAAPGGSGTVASPFATIAEARAALPAMVGVVALARGAYDEEVRVESGDLTIIGACAAETSLTRTAGIAPRAIASARGGHLTVRNLRITGAHVGLASMIDARSRIVADGVQIDDTTTSAGVAFDGAELVLRGSVVRDTNAGPDVGETGRGLQPLDGGSVVLERVVLERVRDVAILVSNASATLTDVAIRGVAQTAAGDKGRAIEVTSGGDAALTRVVVEDGNDVALLVGDAGSVLRGDHMIVRRIVAGGASLASGRGLEVIQGARAELDHVVFDETSSVAVFVQGDSSSAALRDVVIARTRARSDGSLGRGLESALGASSMLARVLVSENRDVALLLTDGASMTAEDLVVDDTESEMASGELGTGLAVQLGASLVLVRGRSSGNRSHGLFAFGAGTTVDCMDFTVTGTRGWESSGVGGVGIGVQNGAELTLARALVSQNREVGILSINAGSSVTASDVAVLDTLHRDCVATGACDERTAGIAAVLGGALTASDFVVADSAFVGAQVAAGGQMDLMNGEIRGNLVGAAVGAEGYDVMRLSNGVAYRDNGTNLDATELPVPGAADPFTGSDAP